MPKSIFSTSIIRAPGQRYEKFYQTIKEDENVFFIKGKVAEVAEDPESKAVTVIAENAVTGEKPTDVDLVVLATGMQPTAANTKLPADLKFTLTASSSMILKRAACSVRVVPTNPPTWYHPIRTLPEWH
jgi:heterodisulfide reductase subunit A-like polyferredoxin